MYNVALLALHRSLFHRLNFIRALAAQLRTQRIPPENEYDAIQEHLTCHIEVLIRTSNNVDANTS